MGKAIIWAFLKFEKKEKHLPCKSHCKQDENSSYSLRGHLHKTSETGLVSKIFKNLFKTQKKEKTTQ
jgi:hypothetical protein